MKPLARSTLPPRRSEAAIRRDEALDHRHCDFFGGHWLGQAVGARMDRRIYDRVTYDAVEVPERPTLVRSEFPDGSPPNLMELHDSSEMSGRLSRNRSPFGDLLRPDHSSAARIGITLTVVAVVVLIGLGGLSIGQTLTELLTR